MKKRSKHADDEEADVQDPVDPAGREGEAAAGTAAPASDHERLTRERDEYLQSWQRATADYQNLRRRVQDDIDSAVASRKKALLTDLLLVLDYLDMALSTPVKTDEGKQLHTGVEATRHALLGALERAGVRPVPDGGRFDPAVHESVASADTGDDETPWAPGEVVETLRRGYTLDGKMLRPAQVKVAGGLEQASGSDDDDDAPHGAARGIEKPETD